MIANVRLAWIGNLGRRWKRRAETVELPAAVFSSLADRMEGCLLLGAAGDAFGFVVEFDDIDTIERKHRGRLKFLDAGKWTYDGIGHVVSDDTQMSLFTAQACATALEQHGSDYGHSIRDLARDAYLQWYQTQTALPTRGGDGLLGYRQMFARRAPGGTCLSALARGGDGRVDEPINDSKGCGGVMRVAPLAFLPGIKDDEAWDAGCGAAALTHGHPLGWASAGAFVLMLSRIARGADVVEAVKHVVGYAAKRSGAEGVSDALRRALMFAGRRSISPEEIEEMGGGWVAEECLAIGASCAMMDANVADILETAANHSGDSDSTALVAGQLTGASYGRAKLLQEQFIASRFAAIDVADAMAYVLCRYGEAIKLVESRA